MATPTERAAPETPAMKHKLTCATRLVWFDANDEPVSCGAPIGRRTPPVADQTRIQEIIDDLHAEDRVDLSEPAALLESLLARDTALRALIAHWREEAAKLACDAPERRSADYGLMLRAHARQMVSCADQLAALLDGPETPAP